MFKSAKETVTVEISKDRDKVDKLLFHTLPLGCLHTQPRHPHKHILLSFYNTFPICLAFLSLSSVGSSTQNIDARDLLQSSRALRFVCTPQLWKCSTDNAGKSCPLPRWTVGENKFSCYCIRGWGSPKRHHWRLLPTKSSKSTLSKQTVSGAEVRQDAYCVSCGTGS